MTEQISALADDEIALADAMHLMSSMQPNSPSADAWRQYHMIGDVMRGSDVLSANFKENLMAKLDLEPTVLSPNAAWLNEAKTLSEAGEFSEARSKKQALDVKSQSQSNHLPSTWAIAASFAAVVVVGWMVLQTQVSNQAEPVLVAKATPQQEPTILASVAEQEIPVEYLMAHQASAPSASSYYIQSASYTK